MDKVPPGRLAAMPDRGPHGLRVAKGHALGMPLRFRRAQTCVGPPTYQASWISVLAYTNRPLYPNGEAAAQGKVPKLLL